MKRQLLQTVRRVWWVSEINREARQAFLSNILAVQCLVERNGETQKASYLLIFSSAVTLFFKGKTSDILTFLFLL